MLVLISSIPGKRQFDPVRKFQGGNQIIDKVDLPAYS